MSKVEGNTNIFFDVDDIEQWRVPNPKKLTKEQAKQLQRELDVNVDGIVGKDTITALQRRLGVDADGKWDNKSQAAYVDEYNDEAQERFNYNRAKEQGKVNPAVVDLFAPVSSKSIKEEEQEEQEEEDISKLPNIEVDNVDIAYLNKEIDKVKKQLEDRQSKYESVQIPNTQVGWASYIANNDRGMLDKYQDAERAWYNKLKDQEHAKELADAQMEQQAAYRMDDNIKNRSLALNKLQYAKAALKNDTSNDPLIKAGLRRDIRNAQEELNYWNKAVGLPVEEDNKKLKDLEDLEDVVNVNKTKDLEVNQSDESDESDDTTTEVKMSDIDAYISGDKKFATIKEQAEAIKKYKANSAYNKDGSYRDKVNKLEAVKSIEAINKAKAARKAKYDEAKKTKKGVDWKIWKRSEEGKALIKEFGE